MGDTITTSEIVKPGRPTTNFSGGTFSISSSTIIRGTPNSIFYALIQVSRYTDWNTFVPIVSPSSTLQLGDKMRFDVQLDPSPASKTASNEQVTAYELGKTLAWKCTDYTAFLKAERIHTITDLGNGTCRYDNHETMGGVASHIVLWAKGQQLKDRFYDWAADLKKYVEGTDEEIVATSFDD